MATRKSTALLAVAALTVAAGTGATLALWSSSADVADVEISSGALTVTPEGDQSVADISGDIGDVKRIDNLADFKIVPGDTIRIAQTIHVVTEGNNIRARVTIDTPVGAKAALADNPTGTELAKDLTVDKVALYDESIAATDSMPTESLVDGHGTFLIEGATKAGGKDYTVVYEVTFDKQATAVTTQDAKATLTTAAVTLDQVRPGQS